MADFKFQVSLSYHEMQALYKGRAQRVIVQDMYGRTISLPALKLKPFLSHNGVHGKFLLKTSIEGKFISLTKTEG
ncbi:DUF2835 family protein [Echinimonas agarilytica]|uniref:DUF2835 domain-containing protein n=1 Tax=Echinimonas agarilytica TaxID=1215918 RepID=A0AA41WB56_9GAMM|nr:DUF2835 family protein [Echinimonas agarilytica]MCM2681156.1 DUF2835 domain-containing protein [Echinimonas agarilytica]